MPIPLSLLRRLQSDAPATAWDTLFDYGWSLCSVPLQVDKASSEVVRRDAAIGAADLFSGDGRLGSLAVLRDSGSTYV